MVTANKRAVNTPENSPPVRSQASRGRLSGSDNKTKEAPAKKKEYVVLTDKAIIDGKRYAVGDRVSLNVEEAARHREHGIGLRFPTEEDEPKKKGK